MNLPTNLMIDELGQCRESNKGSDEKVPHYWDCSYKCKPLTDSEVRTIIDFKSAFEGTTTCVRKLLEECDNCPNTRYSNSTLETLST